MPFLGDLGACPYIALKSSCLRLNLEAVLTSILILVGFALYNQLNAVLAIYGGLLAAPSTPWISCSPCVSMCLYEQPAGAVNTYVTHVFARDL